jgi:Mrp family chromosome partitioning ATPase
MGEIADALRRAERERDERIFETRHDSPRADERERDRSPVSTRASLPAARGPVIGIPRDKLQSWSARALLIEDQQLVGEHFRQFALNVEAALARLGRSSLLVTSSVAQEGKTLTACNLALALASMAGGRSVALVDLDLRRPSVARSLGFRPSVGIEEVLAGGKPITESRATTDVPHLDVFPVRQVVRRAHERLSQPALADVLAQIEEAYHLVVIDGPPALLFPDVSLILPHVGACLAVVRSGSTLRKAYAELVQSLPPEKLIGSFLNEARLPRHTRRYSSYYRDADEADATTDAEDER